MKTKKRNIQKYLCIDKINFLYYNRFESLRKKHLDKIKILCYNNNEVKIWGCMVSTGVYLIIQVQHRVL